jgi:hypothetical protein
MSWSSYFGHATSLLRNTCTPAFAVGGISDERFDPRSEADADERYGDGGCDTEGWLGSK